MFPLAFALYLIAVAMCQPCSGQGYHAALKLKRTKFIPLSQREKQVSCSSFASYASLQVKFN
jgi:hypothetical protein